MKDKVINLGPAAWNDQVPNYAPVPSDDETVIMKRVQGVAPRENRGGDRGSRFARPGTHVLEPARQCGGETNNAIVRPAEPEIVAVLGECQHQIQLTPLSFVLSMRPPFGVMGTEEISSPVSSLSVGQVNSPGSKRKAREQIFSSSCGSKLCPHPRPRLSRVVPVNSADEGPKLVSPCRGTSGV